MLCLYFAYSTCISLYILVKSLTNQFLLFVNFITQFETAYIIWSLHSNDPVNGVFQRHQKQGSTSLSLLGGLPVPRSEPIDVGILNMYAENVS